jgi:hypothetical protein
MGIRKQDKPLKTSQRTSAFHSILIKFLRRKRVFSKKKQLVIITFEGKTARHKCGGLTCDPDFFIFEENNDK